MNQSVCEQNDFIDSICFVYRFQIANSTATKDVLKDHQGIVWVK